MLLRLTRRVCVLLAVLLYIPAGIAAAEEPQPERIDFHSTAQAFANAVANDQVTVMVFSAKWCGACKKVERSVFTDAEVREAAMGTSWAKVDIDQEPQLAAMFGVRAVPTILILNTKGEPLHEQSGMVSVRQMKELLATYKTKANMPGAARGRVQQLKDLTDQASTLPEGTDMPTQTVIQIVELLAKPDPIGAEQTRHRLVAMGPSVWPGLVEALDHDKLAVRAAAHSLLKQTTGQAFAFDPFLKKPERDKQAEAWREWVRENRLINKQTPSRAADDQPSMPESTDDTGDTTPKTGKPPRAPR